MEDNKKTILIEDQLFRPYNEKAVKKLENEGITVINQMSPTLSSDLENAIEDQTLVITDLGPAPCMDGYDKALVEYGKKVSSRFEQIYDLKRNKDRSLQTFLEKFQHDLINGIKRKGVEIAKEGNLYFPKTRKGITMFGEIDNYGNVEEKIDRDGFFIPYLLNPSLDGYNYEKITIEKMSDWEKYKPNGNHGLAVREFLKDRFGIEARIQTDTTILQHHGGPWQIYYLALESYKEKPKETIEKISDFISYLSNEVDSVLGKESFYFSPYSRTLFEKMFEVLPNVYLIDKTGIHSDRKAEITEGFGEIKVDEIKIGDGVAYGFYHELKGLPDEDNYIQNIVKIKDRG